MKPRRLNWKVAVVAGTATSVGIGGFALAADPLNLETPTDDNTSTTVEAGSTEPASLSAPVIVPAAESSPVQPAEPSVESVASVESDASVASVESVASVASIDSA